MTVQEFEARQRTLVCRHCGSLGALTTQKTHAHVEVICPGCRKWDPIGGAPYLNQNGPQTRRPLTRAGESVRDTWRRWQDRCAGCGVTWDESEALGLLRERQHAPPLADVPSESESSLIPMCGWCHQSVTAIRARLRAILQRLGDRLALPSDVVARLEVLAMPEDDP